jgi:hypothetical protein
MNESTTPLIKQFTGCATLAAIGIKLRELKVFQPMKQSVQIAQKTIKDSPSDKLYDAFISLLAGAHGLVEINTRLRADGALQRAFGRSRCAEQSVVQDTLNACTTQNVEQMEQAMDSIYRQHSQGYRHDYQAGFQVLDVDMSGLPCGSKAAFARHRLFCQTAQPSRPTSGPRLGQPLRGNRDRSPRVTGKTQLTRALQPLMLAAEETLQLDEDKRRQTIVRVDAGGGSLDDVNWLLAHGYLVHGKDYSGQQAKRLAKSVVDWYADPRQPEREFGWVSETTDASVRPVRRIAVRCRKPDGKFAYGVRAALRFVGPARPHAERPVSRLARGSGSRAAGVRHLL